LWIGLNLCEMCAVVAVVVLAAVASDFEELWIVE
jgi:hypothetical protein